MFRIRTRKILGDLWARKMRTLLAATSVFIGVFGVVSLSSAGEILVRQLEKDLQQDRLAMIRSSVVLKRDTAVENAAVLDTLRAQPGVTAVEARAIYPVYWHLAGEDRFREGTVAAHSEPFDQSQLEPPRLIEGRFPVYTGGQDAIEVGAERRTADAYGLKVGDQIVLRSLSDVQQDTVKTVTGTVVGIIFQPYDYNSNGVNASLVSPDKLVFADYQDAQRVSGSRGYSAILARFTTFAEAEAQQTAFTSAIASTGYIPVFTNVENPAKNSAIESTRSTNNLLVVLALAALIVSGFLIVNVVNAIVAEQRRQIGLLKALGADGRDSFHIYAGIAFSYGVLGVVPGVALGLPAGFVFAQGLARQSQTIIENFAVSPIGLALGIILGLGVPVAAAVVPVLRGIRVGILEAMTDFGIDANFGSSRLDRLIGNLPLPITLRQTVRNAYQKRFRLALTGITLTLASAAFMGVFAVFSGLTTIVNDAFDSIGYQIVMRPNEAQDFDTIKTLIENNASGIGSIDPSTSLAVDVEGFTPPPVQVGPPGLYAEGYNTANPNILKLDLISGDAWTNDPNHSGVVLSASIADATGKAVGDSIGVTVSGNTRSFEIIGVAQSTTDVVWMNWAQLSTFGGLVSADGKPYPNAIDITLAEKNPSARKVDDAISAINEIMLANGISAGYNNQVALAKLITTIVAAFGVILSLAALLIAMVGAVGLLTTLSMSVFERQKEIGVMRSVGASSGAIAVQFLVEGLLVGLFAWGVAAPLSYLVSQGLIAVLPFGGTYTIAYPLTALLVGLIGIVALVTVASLLPSLSAARKTVSEILRYQ
jgi:putative ABC transport system permease protein